MFLLESQTDLQRACSKDLAIRAAGPNEITEAKLEFKTLDLVQQEGQEGLNHSQQEPASTTSPIPYLDPNWRQVQTSLIRRTTLRHRVFPIGQHNLVPMSAYRLVGPKARVEAGASSMVVRSQGGGLTRHDTHIRTKRMRSRWRRRKRKVTKARV